jgi:signal transduction histidine kinase
LIALIGAMITSRLISQKMIKPILNTVETAKLISKGQYKVMEEDIPDSDELKVLVTTMNQMASSLEQQEKLRKQLTTDVAHELRTPLTTVSSHLEAMIEGVWEPTEDRLRSCYEEIGRITGLVSDLESLSKIEVDNLKLTRTNEDLLEIMNTIKYNFEIETHKKQIDFTITGTSVSAPIDKDRIYQVIVNLVSNAIHYTPEGGSISCSVYKSEKEAVLEVADSGIGISEADLPYIFERFYRTDKSRNRRTGGAGIGLTIAKSIIMAHGGSIEVESKSSLGSRFIVRLPLKTV